MKEDLITDGSIANMTAKYGMGGGAVTSFIGWLSSSEAVILIGVIVTILGFLVNFMFQMRRDKRSKDRDDLEKQIMIAKEKRDIQLFEEQMKQLKEHKNG